MNEERKAVIEKELPVLSKEDVAEIAHGVETDLKTRVAYFDPELPGMVFMSDSADIVNFPLETGPLLDGVVRDQALLEALAAEPTTLQPLLVVDQILKSYGAEARAALTTAMASTAWTSSALQRVLIGAGHDVSETTIRRYRRLYYLGSR